MSVSREPEEKVNSEFDDIYNEEVGKFFNNKGNVSVDFTSVTSNVRSILAKLLKDNNFKQLDIESKINVMNRFHDKTKDLINNNAYCNENQKEEKKQKRINDILESYKHMINEMRLVDFLEKFFESNKDRLKKNQFNEINQVLSDMNRSNLKKATDSLEIFKKFANRNDINPVLKKSYECINNILDINNLKSENHEYLIILNESNNKIKDIKEHFKMSENYKLLSHKKTNLSEVMKLEEQLNNKDNSKDKINILQDKLRRIARENFKNKDKPELDALIEHLNKNPDDFHYPRLLCLELKCLYEKKPDCKKEESDNKNDTEFKGIRYKEDFNESLSKLRLPSSEKDISNEVYATYIDDMIPEDKKEDYENIKNKIHINDDDKNKHKICLYNVYQTGQCYGEEAEIIFKNDKLNSLINENKFLKKIDLLDEKLNTNIEKCIHANLDEVNMKYIFSGYGSDYKKECVEILGVDDVENLDFSGPSGKLKLNSKGRNDSAASLEISMNDSVINSKSMKLSNDIHSFLQIDKETILDKKESNNIFRPLQTAINELTADKNSPKFSDNIKKIFKNKLDTPTVQLMKCVTLIEKELMKLAYKKSPGNFLTRRVYTLAHTLTDNGKKAFLNNFIGENQFEVGAMIKILSHAKEKGVITKYIDLDNLKYDEKLENSSVPKQK
jgi:hypothetical protein